MIIVEIERYHNDSDYRIETMSFTKLERLADYIFENAGFKPSVEGAMPKLDITFYRSPYSSSLEYRRREYGERYTTHTIRTIKDEMNRYLYTDGKLTGGMRVCTKTVQEWIKKNETRCDETVLRVAEG